jgi:primosomal protein N' (replication factor Y)
VRAWGVDRASVRALERRGCVILERRAVVDAFAGACSGAEEATPEPNAAQRAAISAIVGAARAGGYRGFLLHGVTASGKTEVYLRCAAEAIAAGGACLMLVPEIALTPQLVQRVRGRLGGDIAVVHSALPAAERRRAWAGMREGRVRVAVGARSALFAPLSRLALIVVDEEHDASFKQAEGFGYHARDLALLRAQRAGAVVVLGSATPSLESLHNAQVGKLTLLRLPERATPMPLPVVRLVDLRGAGRRSPRYPFLSRDLVEELGRTLARGEQAILFLNRRGFAPAAVCERCGRSVDCAGCGVALAYHRVRDALLCHYCGAERAVPERCAACGGAEFDLRGLGTERVVDAVRALYPEARVGRLDSDVAPGRASEAVLERLRRCEIDVLVGTQMVAKGHDYPGVTLVGIVHADLGLHVPDFRAAERTFQLLTQVAGRAGRGESPGLVLLQTFAPEHYAIETAARQDYEGFARAELAFRAELGYPPFGHLALIRGEGRDERRVRAAMAELAGRLGGAAEAAGVALLGPCPAPRPRLRGRWRYQLLLRGPARRAVREIVARALPWVACARGAVRGAVDIDPVHLA